MRKMKETGLSWLKEIPEDWQISKIKYVATLSPSCDRSELTAESVITYTPMEYIKNGAFINNTEQYGNVPASLTPYQEGDIAMAKVTPCFENGNIAVMEGLANGFGLGSSELIIFRPENIETRFLFYWLRNTSFVERAISTITGTGGLKRISNEFVRNSEIPLPDDTEQKKVAEYLDKKCSQLDSIIDRQHQVIEKLNAYKQSIISETVLNGLNPNAETKDSGYDFIGNIPAHWKVCRLRNIGTAQNGISKGGEFFGKGFPFVSYGDVYKNYSLPTKISGLIESTDEERERYSVEQGDIFFTRTSETLEEVGIASVCEETIPDATFAGFLIRVRPFTDELYVGYSKYFFRSNHQRFYLVKEMNLVTRASLGQDLLKSMPVLIPPMEEQKQIADYLDKKCAAIDSIIAKRQQLIDKLTEYKKSLIFEVVTGKKEV